MLHAHKIVAVEIQEIGCPFVGTQILLRKFESNLVRVLIIRVRIVHWNGKEALRPYSAPSAVQRSVVNVAIPHSRGR